jgi:transglutaminase-like putative cysteine protease
MIYSVRHRTTYRYDHPVTLSTHRLRLAPRDTPTQRLRRFALDAAPEGALLAAEKDGYGNTAHFLEIREPHEELVIEARSEVSVSEAPPPLDATPWEQVAAAAARPARIGGCGGRRLRLPVALHRSRRRAGGLGARGVHARPARARRGAGADGAHPRRVHL